MRAVAIAALLLISAFAVVGVFAQEDPNNEREPNVYGHVVDAQTGESIPALVFIGGPRSDIHVTMEVDETGMFRILLPPGPYVWEAGSEGYNPGRGEFEVPMEGEMRLKIELKPLVDEPEKPEYNLYGMMFVADTDRPVHGVVYIHNENYETKTETARDGSFKLLLRPGVYHWKAIAEGFETQEGRIEVSAEGTRLLIGMIPLDQEEPQQPDHGILVGHVASPDGGPVPHAHVMIHLLDRIYDPTDIDASGEVMGRPDEPPGDPTMPERPPEPNANRPMEFHTETDEEGMFKIRLPFGAYMIEVMHDKFHPYMEEFKITPRIPEVKLRIILKPFECEPEPDWGRMKVHFSYIDRNSDGIPEEVKFAADTDGDGVHDVIFHMLDENSDGNPEVIEWTLDIPLEKMEHMKEMVWAFIRSQRMNGWEKGYGWEGDKDWELPELEEGKEAPIDLDTILEWLKDRKENGWEGDPSIDDGQNDDEVIDDSGAVKEDGEKDDEYEVEDGSTVSDKASSNDDGIGLEIMVAIAAVLLVVLLGLIGTALYLKKRN
ncbi:MAG: carboxypeptidase regulatory-like domain-containing protein [Thermoplasmatota archaeon]